MYDTSITSFSNEKLKFISKLKDKSFRDETGQFFIEGYREITRSLQNTEIQYRSLFIARECFLGKNEDKLIGEFARKKIPIYEISQKLFEKISYRDRPDGLLSVAFTPKNDFPYSKIPDVSTYLVIEGVEKPGNLGTILRTAEGVGDCCIIVTDAKIDLYNPNVIRSSTGTLFTLPVYVAEVQRLMESFKKAKIPILSVTPEAKEMYFHKKLSLKKVLIFGSEQYGLSQYAKDHSDDHISIPMNGSADSLNLAMSVGVILYEGLRQRLVNL
jgi:TrmH family RNA methyltransferase